MKKTLLGALALAGVLVLPAASLAATYQYVNVNGVLESETADTAAQALTQPTDIAANSGVILVPSVTTTVTTTMGSTTGMTASSSSMMASSTDMTASSTSMSASSTMMTASSSMMTASSTSM